jgi:photosystem II stability/assembly factor-like uncharacterized protein
VQFPQSSQVHFETASDGVAWGDGPFEITRDGGLGWAGVRGTETYVVLGWAGGRLWAYAPCVSSEPCGALPLLISDDVGRTWQRVGSIHQGYTVPTVVATSRSTAYVLAATNDGTTAPLQLAVTLDGGATWAYRSVPCSQGDHRFFASNGRSLLLYCPDTDFLPARLLVSTDRGRTWTEIKTPPLRSGPYFYGVTTFGSTYLANEQYGTSYSTDDGRMWNGSRLPFNDGNYQLSALPGVGVWASAGGAGGIWFSADGVRWVVRATASES